MTILIADRVDDSCAEALRAAGHRVVSDANLKGQALVDALRANWPTVLVVRSTQVTAEHLDAVSSLELVVRSGAGTDTIDVEGASQRGIFVANCPGQNAIAVAELTMALLLALDRRIPDNVITARSGKWNKADFASSANSRGLKGRTLGLIGFGHIAQAVAARAQAFGMDIAVWSRSLTDEAAAESGVMRLASPVDVAEVSDIVSVHVAATPATHGLIDAPFFEAMRPGALFINTSRGSVVEEDALIDVLDSGKIRAGLDVFNGEPASKKGKLDTPLAKRPDVYLTHHIGASTRQASEAIAAETARVVLDYAETGRVSNAVNLAVLTSADHLLTVRHHDRVGVLAGVLDVVRQAGWNVEEMENLIFAGGAAACAR
ncbi:MAG: phosphoglycerate dehydrogenase, partial [Bacteroidota bacterium]